MLRVTLITISLAACHQPRCDEADYELDGLCVLENGNNPNKEEISYTITHLGDIFNARFNKSIDIVDVLSQVETSVKYMDILSNETDGTLGVTNNSNINLSWTKIHWEDISDSTNCRLHVAVLAHELMHVLADYQMGVSDSDNRDHDIPHLFSPEGCGWWTTSDDPHCTNNIEWEFWQDAYSWCTPILFPR